MSQSKTIALSFLLISLTFLKESPSDNIQPNFNQINADDNEFPNHGIDRINAILNIQFNQHENNQMIEFDITQFELEQSDPCRFSVAWRITNDLGFQSSINVL